MIPAVSLYTIMLAVHIAAVVVAFGVTFAYILIYTVGLRMDARAAPWFHRVQSLIGQRLITPGLAVVLIGGIYLASKLHVWGDFYVQWGLAAAIVLGGLGGAFFGPRERRLAELAERDIAAAGDGEVVLSAEYLALRRLVLRVGIFASTLVLVTIYLMTVQAGS